MTSSILDSIKTMLGPDVADEHFNQDIIADINTAIDILTQLGVGPSEGFTVTGSTETWTDFLGSDYPKLKGVVSYVYFKVKLMFDPPTTTPAISSIEKLISELEWRLNVRGESGD